MKIICALLPYALEVCVVEGLSLDRRKRACEPPASQMMKRGRGKRSWTSSCVILLVIPIRKRILMG